MAGADAHIGPEHAYAQAAMDRRARDIRERELADPAGSDSAGLDSIGPESDREATTAGVPASSRGDRPQRAARSPVEEASGTEATRVAAPTMAPPDAEDDLEFLDGRWTSEGW